MAGTKRNHGRGLVMLFRETKPWQEKEIRRSWTNMEQWDWCRIPWHYDCDYDVTRWRTQTCHPAGRQNATVEPHLRLPANNSNDFTKTYSSLCPERRMWRWVCGVTWCDATWHMTTSGTWTAVRQCWNMPPRHRGERWSSQSVQTSRDFLVSNWAKTKPRHVA